MPKRLVIHVGCPKTGTTSLQKSVFPRLSAIDYLGKHIDGPDRYTDPSIRALEDAVNAKDDYHFDAFRRARSPAIVRALTPGTRKTAVLSCESFTHDYYKPAPWPKDLYLKAKHLRDTFADVFGGAELDPHILITIRRQDRAIPSQFAEIPYKYPHLYKPDPTSFWDFCSGNPEVGFAAYYAYGYLHDIYARLFGAERVWMVPMEALFSPDGNRHDQRLADLLQADAAELGHLLASDRAHARSTHADGTVTYRFGRRPKWYMRPLRAGYRAVRAATPPSLRSERLAAQIKQALGQRHFQAETTRLDEDLLARIRAYYGADNAALNERLALDFEALGYPLAPEPGRRP